MKRLIASIFALLAFSGVAFAQASIQAIGTRLDVATAVAFATAAVNNQVTATIAVPAGQYVYITAISYDVAQNNTGTTAANNVQFTTTNISGSPILSTSVAGVANTTAHGFEGYAVPLKSAAPGTNVTVVSPAANATAAYTIRVYYYTAP